MSRLYSIGRLRTALLHFVGGRTLQGLARALLVLLVVRVLPPGDYGAYMLLIGLAEMLLRVCSFGLLPLGQRFLPEIAERTTRRRILGFVVAITSAQLLMLALVTALLWAGWERLLPVLGFGAEQIDATRPAIILFLIVPAFRFVVELLEALLEQGRAQLARVGMPLGRLVALSTVLGLGLQMDLERILVIDVIVTLVCLASAWLLLVVRIAALAEPTQREPLPVRAMLRHAWHMSAVDILGSTQEPGAVRMALANALGLVDSGLFAFLQSLQRLVGRYLPGVLLRGIVRPMLISRTGHSDGMTLMEQTTSLLTKLNYLVVAGAAMVALVAGDELVSLASGGRFTGTGNTFVLMMLALACMSQRQINEMLMQIVNETVCLRLTTLLAPVTLAAVWAAAAFSLDAAVVALILGLGLANTLNRIWLRHRTGRFGRDGSAVLGIFLMAGVAALAGDLLAGHLGVWAGAGAGLVSYVLLLLIGKPFGSGELRLAGRGFGRLGRQALQPFSRGVAS